MGALNGVQSDDSMAEDTQPGLGSVAHHHDIEDSWRRSSILSDRWPATGEKARTPNRMTVQKTGMIAFLFSLAAAMS